MTIQLKPEQERIIEEEIRNGHFRSVEEVLDHALAALLANSSSLQSEPRQPRKNLAQFPISHGIPSGRLRPRPNDLT